ncbi:MAG: folate-binding protein YgfZ [Acidimicrobiia bacterium]|nr:folate-binding protein YgfZ [Acidimicrobiia bacterium]
MTLTEQEQLRAGGWFPVHRDVVRIEGPDAATFLQGQLSADVAGIEPGDAAWSLLLSPQGKVDAWLRLTRWDHDVYLADCDVGFGGLIDARLQRFKLRTKADIGVESDQWSFWGVRGPVEVHVEHDAGAPVLAVPVWWPGMVGYDLLAPAGTDVHIGVPQVTAEAAEAVRIECGVPAMGAELTDRTIPAEMGQWFIDASVSFTKGCYTGQELVARIDSRGGNVPRRLRGVVFDDVTDVDPAEVVGATVTVDGDDVGEVTSCAISDALGTMVGLAVVARAVQSPATASVHTADGELEAQVRELPLLGAAPGDEDT